MTLESLSQTTEEAMCDLLKSLDKACLVLPAGMEQVRKFKCLILLKNHLFPANLILLT